MSEYAVIAAGSDGSVQWSIRRYSLEGGERVAVMMSLVGEQNGWGEVGVVQDDATDADAINAAIGILCKGILMQSRSSQVCIG